MNEESRRPLKSRSTAWAGALASALTKARIAPNVISVASVVFAALAGASLAATTHPAVIDVGWLLCLVAGACIQLRLLCNLMDGMVAVEGGLKSPTGELWNEIPDRVADVLILLGAGFAAGSPLLGAIAGCTALGTAYVRAFGASLTGRQDFRGPMAKPQRMATMTAACLLAALAPVAGLSGPLIFGIALWVVAVGAIVTSIRRVAALARSLG